MFRFARLLLGTFCALLAVVLVAPVLIVIPMSFSPSRFLEFPPKGFSTEWFANFFSDTSWTSAGLTSLQVALTVMILSMVLGTLAAIGLVRGNPRFKQAISSLVLAPLLVPYVIIGLGTYAFFINLGLTQTLLGFILIHTALAVPYVTINVSAGLTQFDENMEKAAASLGASPLTVFRTVTVPAILPSMFSGALFAFVTSWDEVVVSQFLAGPLATTLPVKMWAGVRVQIDPTIAAVSTMLVLITLAVLLAMGVSQFITARRARAIRKVGTQ